MRWAAFGYVILFLVDRSALMISKCANPFCRSSFMTTSGRVFSFLAPNGGKQERFWLCDGCARYYTVHFQNGKLNLVEITQAAQTNPSAA